MKKKFVSIFLVLLLISSFTVSAFAEGDLVVDLCGRLKEREALESFAQEIYDSYGLVVSFVISDTFMGKQEAELAEYIYDSYVAADNGIMLLDCLEADHYYMIFRGQGELLREHFNSFCQVYENSQTYDSGVRAYLNSAYGLLETQGFSRRDLVLLEDESVNSLNVYEENESSASVSVAEDDAPLLSLDGSALGAPSSQTNPQIPAQRRYDRVVDLAGVSGKDELSDLNAMADAVSERYGCDVAVAFVRHVEAYSVQSAADDFYDYNGYGYGDDDSGILLYVAVEDREYAMSTYMGGAYAFTDYGLARLENAIMPYLRESDWESAAEVFISECAELLAMADSGSVYDVPQENYGGYAEQEEKRIAPESLGFAALLGLGAGSIPVASMKRSMKSVRTARGASDYVRKGSFDLHYSRDIFIRRSVNRVPRQQPRSNGPGSPGGPGRPGGMGFSGGSTMRVSSSGRSHGGRSGKF